jgi:O-antigen/teichoic acid export membrane protein
MPARHCLRLPFIHCRHGYGVARPSAGGTRLRSPRSGSRDDQFWGLVSQGCASLTSFALVLTVARAESVASFGGFAVAYATFLLLHAVSRGIVGETAMVTLPPGAGRADDEAMPIVVAGGIAILAAPLLVGVALLLPEEAAGFMVLFAGIAPIMLAHDAGRHAAFAVGAPRRAAWSDLALVSSFIGGVTLLHVIDTPAGWQALLIWGIAGAFALAAVWPRSRTKRWWESVTWIRRHRRVASRFGIEAMLQAGSTNGIHYIIAAVSGLPAAGSVRAVQSLFGPANSTFIGLSNVAMPRARTDLAIHGPEAVHRIVMRLSVAFTLLALTFTAGLLAIPPAWGTALLGDTWETASELIVPAGLFFVTVGLASALRLGLRARLLLRASLIVRIVHFATAVVAAWTGTTIGGPSGALTAMAIAALLTATFTVVVLLHAEPDQANLN